MELSYNRNEYIQTLAYKMFVILSAMMRMACRPTSEYAEEIRRRRAMETSSDHDGYVFSKDFIVLADAGYVRVNLIEVDVFVSYVSNVYGYNPKRLQQAVKSVAEESSFKDGIEKDAPAIGWAVCRVFKKMMD